MKKFVLNDETKANSYGFKVLNSGIDLSRFTSNPVILDEHVPSTKKVVGRWLNIRVEGSLLVADAEFDMDDAESAALAGKVERGFIKGCSMGILFSRTHLVAGTDNISVLKKCELFEASIVAVPSNANAISLYSDKGDLITLSAFKTNLSTKASQPQSTHMDFTNALRKMLGLPDTATEQDILDAVQKMVDAQGAQAEALANAALAAGKINAAQLPFYINAAKADFAGASAALSAMPGRTSLAGMVTNKAPGSTASSTDRSKWTLQDYRKFDPAALEKDDALWERLIKAENGGSLSVAFHR